MSGIEYMKSLFDNTAAMAIEAIAKGDDISMDLACKWLWYLKGLAAGARLADYTCATDRLIVFAMNDTLKQLESDYNERLREKA